MTPDYKKQALAYLADRRRHQQNNNIFDEERISTQAHGVDYQKVREHIGCYLAANLEPTHHFSRYKLSRDAKVFAKQILSIGVARTTLVEWLRKYGHFNDTLWLY